MVKLKLIFSFLMYLWIIQVMAQKDEWLTWCEQSNYTKTPRYAETVEFCQRLSTASPLVHYTTFGVSPQGRDLPLLILDREGLTSPEQIHARGRLILMLQACIHPGSLKERMRDLFCFAIWLFTVKTLPCSDVSALFLSPYLMWTDMSVLAPIIV